MMDTSRSVGAARDDYLAHNGFDVSAYTSPTFTLPVFGRALRLPNPPARQRAIARHDLHHVLTGYGTDYVGEAEIGAWELRAGCNTAFLFFINLSAVGLGFVLSPARVWRAWRAGAGHRSLYVDGREIDQLLPLRLGELREQLGIPRAGFDPGPVGQAALERVEEP